MKNKSLFFIIDLLLVLLIGVIFGLTCGDKIFTTGTGTSGFICLLITLCVPSVLYLYSKKVTTGTNITSLLFIAGELAINIYFLVRFESNIKTFWITQAIFIGIYLIALLIIVALFKNETAENK